MRRLLLFVMTGLLLGAGLAQPAPAAAARVLGHEEVVLYGLGLRVEPERQVVPKNIATVVSTYLQAPVSSGEALPFPADATVRATLTGPSFAAPLALSAKPNEPLPIPPLTVPGIHLVENIRVESGGGVLLYGSPESVTVEVIDKLLVTQITTRPLTAEEIRAKGIVYDSSNFQAYNFTAAFAVGAGDPIQVSFPVVLPTLAQTGDVTLSTATVPTLTTPQLPSLQTVIPDTLKFTTQVPNLSVQGFQLRPQDGAQGQDFVVPPIPGVVVIPGDIGFLNQYFSVMLMVGNAAPAGANLVVKDLRAQLVLPFGRDATAGTADDPLSMAQLASGESPREAPVLRPGPDGKLGTADDVNALGPGETGNAEFLVEGRREGSHTLEMEITGVLHGLPVGPVPVRGRAVGALLVRNPSFTLTFTHPDTVAAGEAYQLDVTVTNTAESPANFVRVSLFPKNVSGVTVVGEGSREVEMIPAGDSASVSFDLVSRVSGKVFAATLDSDENIAGRFQLKTSVGELGVPVPPDSLVLPKEAGSLPKTLRDAALGLLGKAWAVATAPSGALPKDVQRFSRKIVFDRAVEVAEAGFRLSLHEPEPDDAAQLLFDFAGSDYGRLAGRTTASDLPFLQKDYQAFDELRRRSVRGDVLAKVVADLLQGDLAASGAEAFHRALAGKVSYRPAHLSVLLSGPGPVPFNLTLVDARGRRLGGADESGKVVKEIPFGDLLVFGDPGARTGELAVLTTPEPGEYRLELRRNPGVPESNPFDLSLVVPNAAGDLRQLSFPGLTSAQAPALSFTAEDPYRLTVAFVGFPTPAGSAAASADAVVPDPAPAVIAAVQQPDADVYTSDCGVWRLGRVAAVLFSEEVTPASVQDKVDRAKINAYTPEENQVVGVSLQPGRRIAFLAFRDPVGPFVDRTLGIADVADTRGHVMAPWTGPLEATLDDPGQVLSGRVLYADGAAAEGAEVRLFTEVRVPDKDGACVPYDLGVSSKRTGSGGAYGWDYIPDWSHKVVGIDPDTDEFRAVRFAGARDGQRLNVDVVFLGRGTVTGRAFAQDGVTPLEGAAVKVTSLTDLSEYGARTDRNGRFTLTRVPVGNLLVEAVHVATLSKVVQSDYLPAAGATVERDLVLISDVEPAVVVLRATVSGHVLRADGATPVQGVPVAAYYQAESQAGVWCPSKSAPECAVAVAATDAAGAFSFAGVPAGRLRVYAFDQARLEQGDALVEAPPDQTATVNVLLSGGFGTVRGVVLDADGNPVAGATVGGGLSLTTTDANGVFVLTDVPLGTRELVAASQTLGSLGSFTVNLVTPGETVGSTIVLPGRGSVAGRILGADGVTPASDVAVYVLGKDSEGNPVVVATGLSDADGGYRIDGVPLGEYRLSAFKADLSQGNVVPFALKVNRQTVALDVRFRGKGRVTGVVYGEDGVTPLPARVSVSALAVGSALGPRGALVGLQFEHVQHLSIKDTDFSTGRFSFDDVFVGPFVVTAAGAFSPDPVTFAGELTSPGQTANVVLRLTPTSQVRGTVYQPDGVTPVGAGVSVTFQSDAVRTVCTELGGQVDCKPVAQGVQEETVYTDAQGRYWVPLVNAGSFKLTAADDATGRTGRVSALVQAGQTAEVPLRLTGRGSVAVQVLGSDGTTEIGGARVRLDQTVYPYAQKTAFADAHGRVLWDGGDSLAEGPFAVSATDVEGNGYSGRAAGKVETDGQAVTVKVYVFDASGAVYGTVYRQDRTTAVANAEVQLVRGGTAIGFTTTDAQGAYRIDSVPLGAFSVAAFEAATGRRAAGSGRVDLDRQEVPVNLVETAVGLVRGSVLSSGGLAPLAPLVGWQVALTETWAGGQLALRGTTGLDGAYSFPGVPVGAFSLAARGTGGTASGSGVLTREGEIVEIPLVAKVAQTAQGTVAGWVFLPGGSPARDVPVTLGLARSAVSGSDGSFSFSDVPLGRWKVTARSQVADDSGAAYADLVFAGETAYVSVTLQGTGAVAGTVLDSHGAAVGTAQVALQAYSGDAGCGEPVCTVGTTADGAFQFSRVPAGRFTVTATDAVSLLSGSTGGVVAAGLTTTVTPILEPSASLTGRAVSAAGAPAQGVIAELVVAGRTLYKGTDADGRFTFGAVSLDPYALNLTDPLTGGLARATGTLLADADLGTLVLDEAPPSVASVTPARGAVGVALDSAVRLVFSEPVREGTLTQANVQVIGPSGAVRGVLAPSDGDRAVTFTPLAPFAQQTRYTVLVKGVEDALGRVMASDFVSTFTAADLTPPSVLDASPAADASGVSLDAVVRLHYSEPVDPAGFSGPAIVLSDASGPVAGTVGLILGNTGVVFTPLRPLAEATRYTVAVQPARDLSGNVQAPAPPYGFSTTDRSPPVIGGLLLSGGGLVTQGATATVTAQFSGAPDVAFVDYFVNGVLAGTSRQSPFTFSFAAAPSLGGAGAAIAVSAVPTDTSGNRGAAVASSFTVVADAAPTVAVTAPAAGAAVETGARVTLTVRATDDLGVARLGWLAEGARAPSSGVLSLEGAPAQATRDFSFSVPSDAAPGSAIRLTATAADTRGQVVESAPVSLTVVDATPPQVSFTGVSSGTRVRPGETVTAVVSASDAGGVGSVAFRSSGAAVASLTRVFDPPQASVVTSFSVAVPAAATAADRLTLSASATDRAGSSTQAADVVLAIADLVPPTVALRTQAGATQVAPGQDVVLVADASDDAGVVRVDLSGSGAFSFSDSKAVSPPSSGAAVLFTVRVPSNAPIGGTVTCQARAVDDSGNQSTLASLTLTVTDVPSLTLPASSILLAGDGADVTVTASVAAPAGGLTVSLSAADGAVARVPLVVTIPEGSTSATFTVQGLAGGTTAVRALLQGVLRASTTVTVRGGVVSGTVHDPSSAPVSGAKVTVNGLAATTDAQGRFVVEGVSGLDVSVEALDPATQLRGAVSGTLSAANGYWRNVTVNLAAAGSVSGDVFLSDGTTSAGAGAKVSVFDAAHLSVELYTAHTDENGHFTFPVVPLGTYAVEASDAAGNRGRVQAVVTESGQLVTVVLPYLARGTVRGTVRDGTGALARGVTVTLTSQSPFGGTMTTSSALDGAYSFAGVFAGDLTLSAVDGGTGFGAAGAGTLTSEGQILEVNLQLASFASLEGVVYRADGTTPVPGARVVASGGYAADTDADGRYRFPVLPLGTYALTAVEAATRSRVQGGATLAVQGETKVSNLVFPAQGTVVATVVDAVGALVAGATVGLSDTYGTVSGLTGADGMATLEHVAAGAYTVHASAGDLSGRAEVAVTAGQVALVTVALEPVATLSGTVFQPDGATPVEGAEVHVSSHRFTTGADGTFSFSGLRLSTYYLSVYVDGVFRAFASGLVLSSNGQVLPVSVSLVGLGTVQGRVVNPDGSSAGDVPVTVSALNPGFRRTFSTTTDANGNYSVDGVPAGAVSVSAGSYSMQLLGEATGTLASHGGTLTLDIRLQNNAISLPRDLYDANDFRYQILADGTIGVGTQLFGSPPGGEKTGPALGLSVGGTAYAFGGSAIATQEEQSREMVVRQDGLGGLNVVRKVYVPAGAYFARYLELLTNPTAEAITADVRVDTGFGRYLSYGYYYQFAAAPIASSSGDATLDAAADLWATFDDSTPDDPTVCENTSYYYNSCGDNALASALVWGGAGAALPVSTLVHTTVNQRHLVATWNQVTVEPGQTVALLHFVSQQATREGAAASAERLVQLPPEALAGLSRPELAAIRNFAAPADGSSLLPPLPTLGGAIAGRFLLADGTTAAANSSPVRLKSTNPLFGRTYQVNSSYGDFTFESHAKGIPLEPFEVWGRLYSWGYQWYKSWPESPPVTGTFPEGSAAAVQDLIFPKVGRISGTLRYRDGTAVSGSYWVRVFDGDTGAKLFEQSGMGGSDGAYTTGLFASNASGFTVQADSGANPGWGYFTVPTPIVAEAAAGPLSGNDSTVTQDLTLPYNGAALTVQALDADGAPLVARNYFDVTVRRLSDDSSLETWDSWQSSRVTTSRIIADADGVKVEASMYLGSFGTPTVSKVVPFTNSGTITLNVTFPVRARSLSGTVYAWDGATTARSVTVDLVRSSDGAVVATTGTNSSGAYSFSNVILSPTDAVFARASFQGATVEATPTFTNGAGTQNFTLPLSWLSGRLYAGDGVTGASYGSYGPHVWVLKPADQSSLASASITDQGAYQTPLFAAPEGGVDVKFRWVNGTTGDTLSKTERVSFARAGEARTLDGTLPITVVKGTVYRYGGAMPVDFPSVHASQPKEGGGFWTYYSRTYGGGLYDVLGVGLGDFTVTASQGGTGVTGQATGTVSGAASAVTVDVVLEPVGSVTGTLTDRGVLKPSGLAKLLLTERNTSRSVYGDGAGVYRFDDVPLAAYSVWQDSADGTGRLSPAVAGQLTTPGEVQTVDLDLPGFSTVSGTVYGADGSTPLTGKYLWIDNTASNWSRRVTTDSGGRYAYDQVPPGPITVEISSGGLVGRASGTVEPGGTLVLDLVVDSYDLGYDYYYFDGADGFRYDVAEGGYLRDGGTASGSLDDAYDSAYYLVVNGTEYGNSLAKLSGRQLTLGTDAIGGLQVYRKLYSPAAGGFLRYLDVVSNPGASAATATVRVTAYLGSDSNTLIVVPPSSTGNTYAVTTDNGFGDPSLGHVFAGAGAPAPVTATQFADRNDTIYYEWSGVSVPAGGKKCFLHFAIQRGPNDQAGVATQAQALAGLTDPNALTQFTAEDKACIVNFQVPP